MAITLINKDDVTTPRSRIKKIERSEKESSVIEKKEGSKEIERSEKNIVKKKTEKPVRILRIRYYEKISLQLAKNGKLEQIEAVAVNRGLEDLLRVLGYNIKIQGTTTSHDCILVEKGNKMGIGNKYIFVDIGTNDFYDLKKQMENHTTICAYNQGEFMILDGKRSSLTETFDIPKTWKDKDKDKEKDYNKISDTNILILREKLRNELKGPLKQYHSHEDDQIDRMKESELIQLKRLVNRKMESEDINRKFYEDFLK